MKLNATTIIFVAMLSGSHSLACSAESVSLRIDDDDPNENSAVICSVEYSPDGSLLAAAYGRFIGLLQEPRPGQAIIWDPHSGERRATCLGHADGVSDLAFSPNGKLLATAGFAGAIKLWDTATARERLTIKAGSVISSMAFSPDGGTLAAGVWSGSYEPAEGNNVRLWDVRTGRLSGDFTDHQDAIRCVSFSPDGALLASGSMDGTAKIWDLAKGTVRATLRNPEIEKVVVAHLRPANENAEPGVVGLMQVETLAFSPDGETLVTANGSILVRGKPDGITEVTFWDVSTTRRRTTLQGCNCMVRQVTFSPDGRLLATAGADGFVRLWDVVTLAQVATLDAGDPIAFSPDGKHLVVNAGDRTLKVMKLTDWTFANSQTALER